MTRRRTYPTAVDRLEQQRIEREERLAHPDIVQQIVDANKPPHSPRKRTPLVEGQAALPL